MAVDKNTIQKLRDVTSAGVMECKKALEEAGGDFDKALKIIGEHGAMKVEKRGERETGAGVIVSYIHNKRIGSLVDLRAETDFVVNSDPFQELAHEIAMQVAAAGAASVEELLAQPYIKDESRTISDLITEVIAKVGENVRVSAIARLSL